MRGLRAAALAAALCCGVAPVAAQPTGGLGVRLLDGERYVVVDVRPGERLLREVEVANTTAEPLDVALYAGAATAAGPDDFSFAEGRAPNELTGWTRVRPASVRLLPGRAVTVTVEVAVPTGAAPGRRQAVVWAEQVQADAGVTLVSRVGVRMHVTVGAGRERGLPAVLVLVAGLLVLLVGGLALRAGRPTAA